MRALTLAAKPYSRTWRLVIALGVASSIGHSGCGSSGSDESANSEGGDGGGSTTGVSSSGGTAGGGDGSTSGTEGGDTTSTATATTATATTATTSTAAGDSTGSTGGTAAGDSTGSTGGTAGGGSGGGAPSEGVTCVASGAFCRAEPPTCPEMQVPAVEGTCWGDCVPIGDCVCEGPDDCPDANQYTCHNFSGRCGPYL